tara:strand:- start:28 stop:309 length:282 start_codon:yes stop_codon:yes gene_type:complete
MDFLVSLGVGKERDKGRGGFSADHAPMAPPAARHREITEVNICSGEQMFTCDLFDGSKIPIHAEPVQQFHLRLHTLAWDASSCYFEGQSNELV